MLLPKYSLRWIFAANTVIGLLCTVFAFAARGHMWAVGFTIGLISLALCFVFYILSFAAAWIFMLILQWTGLSRRERTPFLQTTSVEQILPPSAPE